jgi:hypothetical protein
VASFEKHCSKSLKCNDIREGNKVFPGCKMPSSACQIQTADGLPRRNTIRALRIFVPIWPTKSRHLSGGWQLHLRCCASMRWAFPSGD